MQSVAPRRRPPPPPRPPFLGGWLLDVYHVRHLTRVSASHAVQEPEEQLAGRLISHSDKRHVVSWLQRPALP